MGEEHDEHGSIEELAAAKQHKREEEERRPTLITLDVRPRPGVENPFMVGSLRLKGDLPVREDLNAGDLLTVQVAGPDGSVLTSGIFEVGLPQLKDIKQKGVGVIGTERFHPADFEVDA